MCVRVVVGRRQVEGTEGIYSDLGDGEGELGTGDWEEASAKAWGHSAVLHPVGVNEQGRRRRALRPDDVDGGGWGREGSE